MRAINFTQNLVTSACENSTLRGFLFLLGRGNGEISLHREKQPNLKVPSPVLQPAQPTFMSYYPQGLNSKWSDLFFPFPGILYLQMLTPEKARNASSKFFPFFFFLFTLWVIWNVPTGTNPTNEAVSRLVIDQIETTDWFKWLRGTKAPAECGPTKLSMYHKDKF